MKIAKIEKIEKRPVYDITVKDAEHYILKNGVVTHNTGIYYSANTIFIVGRQQDKKGAEILGYKFVLNAEKSRFIKEKSKLPFGVSWEAGIDRWSGLLDIAQETGHVIKPKNGWYTRVIPDKKTGEVKEDKQWRAKDTSSREFWEPILRETDFADQVEKLYCIGTTEMFHDSSDIDITGEDQ